MICSNWGRRNQAGDCFAFIESGELIASLGMWGFQGPAVSTRRQSAVAFGAGSRVLRAQVGQIAPA